MKNRPTRIERSNPPTKDSQTDPDDCGYGDALMRQPLAEVVRHMYGSHLSDDARTPYTAITKMIFHVVACQREGIVARCCRAHSVVAVAAASLHYTAFAARIGS